MAKIENPPYATLISRCDESFSRQSDALRPQAWARRITRFVATHRSSLAAEQYVTHQICAKWGVQTPEEISDIISYPLGKDYVANLLSGKTASHPLVTQIIVECVMPVVPSNASVNIVSKIVSKQKLISAERSVNAAALGDRISEICIEIGVPPNFFNQWISGASMNATSVRSGVGRQYIRRLVTHPEVSDLIAILRAESKQKKNICTELGQVKKTPKPRISSSASFEERRAFCRLKLLKLKVKLPTASRTVVFQKNGKLGNWLRQNDKDWLEENLPSRRPAKSAAKALST